MALRAHREPLLLLLAERIEGPGSGLEEGETLTPQHTRHKQQNSE